MGRPRKNEQMRLYKEKDGGYFLIYTDESLKYIQYDALANVLHGPSPSLGNTLISPAYFTYNRPKRVQWDELPTEWQSAFLEWMPLNFDPRTVRGFWRVAKHKSNV